MRRLRLFAKGNLDLRDTLVACREDGVLRWNGINQLLRPRGISAHVRHETATRSDALRAADGAVPAALAAVDLPPSAYPLSSQFSAALFDAAHDAVILSLQPDLMTVLARHRADGYLFYPDGYERWPAERRRWLAEHFIAEDPLSAEQAMWHLAAVVARLRRMSAAPILVYTVPAAVAGEWIHDHSGLAETLATRIRRFNLGLIDLSRDTGLSIVDVDAIVAREGAGRMTLDPLHLTAEGCRLVAEEVVRVLDDLGCLGDAACG
ncbi:SGNH/GDSL hydrolase family protein [Sphingomonas profundi]|uniref:SGNH/GDSL hydrolase family protein n=1 Tax=Alterirhizorhabdus profundi TaxID=2681549 RepID=UPI0012E7ED72|nr:SGNH/GDSL hydrolase family protein [Sphingomonas profundi]